MANQNIKLQSDLFEEELSDVQEIFNKIQDIFLLYLLQLAAKRSLRSLIADTVNAVSVQQIFHQVR